MFHTPAQVPGMAHHEPNLPPMIAEEDEVIVEDESDEEGAGVNDTRNEVENLDDDVDVVEDAPPSDYVLRGKRAVGEFVWVDVEGEEQRAYTLDPPVGLAVLTSNESGGKVKIKWYAPAHWSWSGKKLSTLRNCRFTKFWDKTGGTANHIWFEAEHNTTSIIPVRVEAIERMAEVKVSRPCIDALIQWSKDTKAKKTSAAAAGKRKRA